ncbi:ABC transporter permease [Corynebacterium spheniscorum]|uniref:NitT/TauT family transport system permease protein n=1 Tax=Corynebacterium spheniscorum TaxID=185761 RepID=A0A1I2S437_9CORY|nr:ABC transporter permease subunit [Corynebacterium spheniscorum]KAA8721000.1 ABC transporter permease subunit [Corynebacterium spheniscorum]SFG44741.1 NitT/TauT family transport system permease protein [Corynebacterium spheniscorum]
MSSNLPPIGPGQNALLDQSGRTSERRGGAHPTLWRAGGWLVILVGWALLARSQLDYILPGPMRTWQALVELTTNQALLSALALTMGRGAVGLGVALLIGVTWGFLNAKFPRFAYLSMPFLQILMSTPGIIFVIVAMVWFGTNGIVVVFVVAAVTVPLLTAATAQAFAATDPDLLEMASVFRLSRKMVVRQIIVPTIAPPILAATTVALGQSIRVSVMAELLATASGIGADIRLAQINIETPDVFAYALVMTAVTFCLELVLVAPVKRRMSAHLHDELGTSN